MIQLLAGALPETLLGPLLDAAAGALRALDPPDVPVALRALRGFHERGMHRATARRQLLRAIETDDGFRALAVEEFLARPEAKAALEGWTPGEATASVDAAAARSDLPLLASALFAARPPGWAFGLGLASATFERSQRAREADAELEALRARAERGEQLCRDAEAATTEAVARAGRLERELRDERASRRAREEQARRATEAAERRVEEVLTEGERLQRAAEAAREQARRAEERARSAEQRARGSRGAVRPPAVTLTDRDLRTLEDAADLARRLADGLGGVAERVRARREASSTSTGDGATAGVRHARRVAVSVPPGLSADSPDGVGAILATPNIAVLVDGYNVTMRGWPDLDAAAQRGRLVRALAGLHARTRAELTVVFDGADVAPGAAERQPGVRVRFSAPGEEADAVIVREVAALASTVPALVVSSDRWVREHAEREGATVVSSSSFLAALHA